MSELLKARVLSACGCCGDLDVEHPVSKARVRVETHSPRLGLDYERRMNDGEQIFIELRINPTKEERIADIEEEIAQLRVILEARKRISEPGIAKGLGVAYLHLNAVNESYEDYKIAFLSEELEKLRLPDNPAA